MHSDHSEDLSELDQLGTSILDAAFKVHRIVGPGLLEAAYEAFLAHELEARGHKIDRQLALPAYFEGAKVEVSYRVDLMVDDRIVVEVKAVDQLMAVHEAQLLTYLRISSRRLGYLINFNVPLLKQGIRRKIL